MTGKKQRTESFLNVFCRYIWQHRLTVILFFIFCGVFSGIFSLYRLEVEAILYAGGLCFLIGFVTIGIHFFFFYRNYQELVRIREHITLLTDQLPPAAGIMEEEYQAMIAELQRIRSADLTNWDAERRESIDYYTTWIHQIKVPIAIMRLILQGEDTPEHQELLSELFRIEQYAEMVLSYFRLDSTSSDFLIQSYDLDEIIRQTIRKYAPQFIRKHLRLIYEGTDAVVLTDEKWLCFILEQLLSNAIKYTETGSVTISVDERKVVSITDTGIGIAPEDLPRIFERGFTGYNGRSDKKSTGLGLYLCKKAADKLFIRLGVSSQVEKGSTFSVDLHTEELMVE